MEGPIRLAIVDDHKMVRQTWRMILESHKDIEVVAECASGEEAIECAEKIGPDIMLMDINMKPVNGFEATRRISESFPHIKIIGISINNQPTYARNMFQLGARGYVTKNSPPDEMFTAIFAVNNGGNYVCEDVKKFMNKGSL
ncbi:MAG TPA: response regulator transcription factor [Flavisolibacter sp.]|nr:response regulator transcription factor [Flavisolibacter sp.]